MSEKTAIGVFYVGRGYDDYFKGLFSSYFYNQLDFDLHVFTDKKFDNVDLIKWHKIPSNGDNIDPSEKVAVWNLIYLELAIHYSNIILCDVDIVFLKKFNFPELSHGKFVGVTVKLDELWPINSGVVFLKSSKEATEFMHEWEIATKNILVDRVLYKNSLRNYGGADQMSLWNIAIREDESGIKYNPIISEMRCEVWNCTQSLPSFETIIYHFKGPSMDIFRGNLAFTQQRPALNQIYIMGYLKMVLSYTSQKYESIYIQNVYDKGNFLNCFVCNTVYLKLKFYIRIIYRKILH